MSDTYFLPSSWNSDHLFKVDVQGWCVDSDVLENKPFNGVNIMDWNTDGTKTVGGFSIINVWGPEDLDQVGVGTRLGMENKANQREFWKKNQ